jgi:hypothetical protein
MAYLDPYKSHNHLYDVAKGIFPNESALNIFGFNRAIGVDYETVWNDGATYAFPPSALIMSVVSTSASDVMSVLISGLDVNYEPITETVTLTGIVPVSTVLPFFRINTAIILSGCNIGDITLTNNGVKYAFIEAELGLTQSCIYTVPAGHSVYIFRIDANSATTNANKFMTIRNVTTKNGRSLRVSEATFAVSQVSYDRQIPFKIEEKTDFQFEAKSSSGTNEIAIFVEATLARDPV